MTAKFLPLHLSRKAVQGEEGVLLFRIIEDVIDSMIRLDVPGKFCSRL